MTSGRAGIGIAKHRKSGKVVNAKHFTGKKGKHAKRKSLKRVRRHEHKPHVNKYT